MLPLHRTLAGAAVAVLMLTTPRAQAADVGQNERIELIPPQGQVGTRFHVVLHDFPNPSQSGNGLALST